MGLKKIKMIFLFLASACFACTDFVVQAKDGAFVNGRSLEFGLDLKSTIRVYPKGRKSTSQGPGSKSGMSWTSKYGYLGINLLNTNISFDGINEAGLSFAYLWLPGVTDYPSVQDAKKVLDYTDFCSWVLGNFASVEEVKASLADIAIWAHPIPSLGLAPVHAAIHDAKGRHLVIEFVGGSMQVYDNPISVMTNSPPFVWQIANLENYLHLSPYNPSAATFRGATLSPVGQGGGFLGLPGDFSPPSRFVKIFTLLRFASQPADAQAAVNLAEHLLNSVDIPLGAVRDADKDAGDYTQWVVIKDLTNRALYFRSYEDLVLKKLDLKKLNFNRENKNSLSLDIKKGYIDLSDSLRESMTVMAE